MSAAAGGSVPSRRAERAARHVVLVGMMGTGKTTVGSLLARLLRRPFVDSDAQVMARTGRTVAEIWETEGEAAFRRLESEALADALAREDPLVVAAAGGVVKDADNRRRLQEAGTVIWLRADPATLEPRVRRSTHRPLLVDDALDVLTRLNEERTELYREVADEVIDVEGHTPTEIADLISGLVE